MRAGAGWLQAQHVPRPRIDQPDAVGHHVGDVEGASVGRELDVLGHRSWAKADRAYGALVHEVDDEHSCTELARDQGGAAVGRVVHVVDARALGHIQGGQQPHAVRPRKSSSRRASATTIARRPSAVKYRLYGSDTGTGRPGRPLRGSIGVRLLPRSLVTHSVRRSHEGVTCCGCSPVAKCLTMRPLRWSISSTVFDPELGTYTRGGSCAATRAISPERSAA